MELLERELEPNSERYGTFVKLTDAKENLALVYEENTDEAKKFIRMLQAAPAMLRVCERVACQNDDERNILRLARNILSFVCGPKEELDDDEYTV